MNRTSTRKDLLLLAQDLLQRRGAAGFSFQDLADRLKIRKASIHYHFGSKQDLLEALCDEYLSTFMAWQESVAGLSVRERWRRYGQIFRDFIRHEGKICPVGALGVDVTSLPAPVRARLRDLQNEHGRWIGALVKEGQRDGVFRAKISPKDAAATVGSAIQGALLIARLHDDFEIWDRVFTQLTRFLERNEST